MKIFLSYNSKNRPFVENLARNLKRDGFELFYDSESIIAGGDWSKTIQSGIENSDAALIFIGESGIGQWQNKEIISLTSRSTNSRINSYRIIILVILPSINSESIYEPDWVLVNYQWVEFKDSTDAYAYSRVIAGLQASSQSTDQNTIGENPYKGLQSFEVGDDSRFTGRTFELSGSSSRLLSVDENKVDVAHEVLIREWPLLRKWIAKRRTDIRFRDRLLDDLTEFNRGSLDLYVEPRLSTVIEWVDRNPNLGSTRIRDFIDKCVSQKERERLKRENIITTRNADRNRKLWAGVHCSSC